MIHNPFSCIFFKILMFRLNRYCICMERVFKYMMERVFKYMMFEFVFHWKEAAQRSRIRVLSVGKNLQRGPGAGRRPREPKREKMQ